MPTYLIGISGRNETSATGTRKVNAPNPEVAKSRVRTRGFRTYWVKKVAA